MRWNDINKMPRLPGIYRWKNLKNGKVYIGKSLNLYRRLLCYKNPKSKNINKYLRHSISKYGIENFSLISLETYPQRNTFLEKYILEREAFWIKFYDAINPNIGYNICAFSRDSTGRKGSKEESEKKSKSRMGSKNPCYGKFGKNHPAFGQTFSEETRKKISNSHKGKIKSEEHIEKIAKKRRRAIIQKDDLGNYLREFKSAREALIFLFGEDEAKKKDESNIFGGIKLGRKRFGYFWEFANPKPTDKILNIPPKDVRVPVVQIDFSTDEIIKVWPSIMEAAKNVGVSPNAIAQCLKGITFKSGGFKWGFA